LIFKHWKSEGAISISPTPKEMSDRVQAFWREDNDLREGALAKVQELAQYLVESQTILTEKNIKRVLTQTKDAFAKAVMALESRKKNTSERIKEVQQQDARFRKESEHLLSEFSSLIDSCDVHRIQDKETMDLFFEGKTNPEYLSDLIEAMFDDKREAQEGIGNYVGQLLTGKLESTLKQSGNQVSHQLDSILVRWSSAMPSFKISGADCRDVDINVNGLSNFDARAAFIGGLAGIGSLGAMALYVSTIASNLGAYILVGKVAGVLVSLGIIGSVTTATSFVAAIGGPITIGVALAALISLAIYRLLGGSWQKALAKKVSKGLEEADAISDIHKTVDKFWDSTKTALAAGLRELRIQSDAHLESLKQDAKKDYDPKLLQVSIDSLQSIQGLFEVENC
jgi:hypothetical protein